MDKLLAAIRESGLLSPGDTVCCALSGGADSVALTHGLYTLREELGITLTACHFNHRLRGQESDEDERFCRRFCAQLGIPLTVGSDEVSRRCDETGESLEEAARHCRYAFFAAQCGKVATAHTADDQLETLLVQLLRGTGLRGLGGIPPQRDLFVRPLLTVSREDVEAYLAENGLSHREDRSNAEDFCLRNRLRHRVIPLLKKENPALLTGICRTAQLLRQDEALLQKQADALFLPELSVSRLRSAPPPLRRRALRRLLEDGGVVKHTSAHLLSAEALVLGSDPSASVSLPGGKTLRREYDRVILDVPATGSFAPVILPCPGQVSIPQLGLTFFSTRAGAPITVRPRQPGDRIRLPGGTKSVKKLLIDRKIPALDRDRVPILEQNGTILSVWGVADADVCGITCKKERGEQEL